MTQPEARPPNHIKHARYVRAHERLNLALDQGFFIEAAMICESIITDRLHSHLHWRVTEAGTLTPDDVQQRLPKVRGRLTFTGHGNLGYLIKVFHLDFDHFENDRHVDLPARLDAWRDRRNRIAHGTVYTEPAKKSYADEFDAFMKRAEDCARDGKPLLNCLNDWDRSARARHRRQARATTAL